MVALNFTVVDSNDNNPVFNPSSYFANLKENSKTGSYVIDVNASESDSSSNIGYYIAAGDQMNKFAINQNTVRYCCCQV